MADCKQTTKLPPPPTPTEVINLCGKLATSGRTDDAWIVGRLWQNYLSLKRAAAPIRQIAAPYGDGS